MDGNDETNQPGPDVQIPEGARDISPGEDGGIWKVISKEGQGDGRPASGDTCFLHYTGTLVDGTKFDSSRDRGEPFSFQLGRSQVIKGWDVTVATMKKGESCKIILKPEYGYGAMGSSPRIPPNSTLIFDMELIKWEGEDVSPDKDKSILRSVLKEGEKYESPNDGAKIDAHIAGWYNGNQFFNSDVQFVLGEASEIGLPEGVDKVLKKFNKGEHSQLHMKSHWAYGKEGNAQFNIPPNADIDMEIHLKSFDKAKQSWEMDDDEKLDAAEKSKQRGTEFFQQGKNKLAIDKYKAIVDLLQHETHLEDEKKDKRSALLVAANNNLAMVYLKTNETIEAIKYCEKVLEEEAKNVKALYRRAQAYQNQKDFEDAIKGYEQVLELEPENKAAQLNIVVCRNRATEERKRQKAVFANMFEKYSKSDDTDNQETAPPQKTIEAEIQPKEAALMDETEVKG